MNTPIRRTAQEWSALISQQEKSGISQRAFCDKHNLSYASFAKWRQTVKKTNNDFLPITTQAPNVKTNQFSMNVGWGNFSLSITL